METRSDNTLVFLGMPGLTYYGQSGTPYIADANGLVTVPFLDSQLIAQILQLLWEVVASGQIQDLLLISNYGPPGSLKVGYVAKVGLQLYYWTGTDWVDQFGNIAITGGGVIPMPGGTDAVLLDGNTALSGLPVGLASQDFVLSFWARAADVGGYLYASPATSGGGEFVGPASSGLPNYPFQGGNLFFNFFGEPAAPQNMGFFYNNTLLYSSISPDGGDGQVDVDILQTTLVYGVSGTFDFPSNGASPWVHVMFSCIAGHYRMTLNDTVTDLGLDQFNQLIENTCSAGPYAPFQTPFPSPRYTELPFIDAAGQSIGVGNIPFDSAPTVDPDLWYIGGSQGQSGYNGALYDLWVGAGVDLDITNPMVRNLFHAISGNGVYVPRNLGSNGSAPTNGIPPLVYCTGGTADFAKNRAAGNAPLTVTGGTLSTTPGPLAFA
jgi:hypothetical protein